MVGLRTAWSRVPAAKAFIVWLQVLWVLLSPLTLSWHHALAHSYSACKTGACAGENCSTSAPLACPFQSKSAFAEERLVVVSACDGREPFSPGHHCSVCEMLLYDDVITVQWFNVLHSERIALFEARSPVSSVDTEIAFPWDVRGPPKLS